MSLIIEAGNNPSNNLNVRINTVDTSLSSVSIQEELDTWEITRKAFKEIGCERFPQAVNFHEAAAQRACEAWAANFNIPYSKEGYFERLMAGAYPYCSEEKLILFSCWVTMFFYYDDLVEKKLCNDLPALEAFNKKNLKILRGEIDATKDDHSIAQAIHTLREEFRKVASPKWLERFATDFEEHLQATVWESTKKEIPIVQTYLKWRVFTSGVYVMHDLCELAEDVNISDSVFQEEYFKKFRQLGNLCIIGSNDIVSYAKEAKGTGNNIIHYYMEHEKLSLTEAVEKAKSFCLNQFENLLQLWKEVPPHYNENEKNYLRGILYWVRANFDWSLVTKRYQKPAVQASWLKA